MSRGTHGPWWWGKLQAGGNCSPGMRCAWLSRFGRTDVPSSYLLSISFHHTLLTTLYQKCVDIIPSHLDPKIVPELPRCGSAFLSGKAFSFFFFITMSLWLRENIRASITDCWQRCYVHHFLALHIPHKSLVLLLKINDSAFHLFLFFISVHGKKYTRGGKLSVCAFQTLPDKYDLLTRLFVTVEAESYLQLSFFFLTYSR